MSETQEDNNNGAVSVQPILGNDNHSHAPSTQGTDTPAPSAPSGGIAPPPIQGTGDLTPPAGGDAFPDLADYATGLFEGVEPESLDYKLFERARVAAHKAGIPQDALSSVMGDVRTFINETEAQIAQERLAACDEQLKQLQQTYGSKFKAVMEACNNTLNNLAVEFGVDAHVFDLPEIRNNPEVVKFFYGLSQRRKEAGFAHVNQLASIATAEQELESIYNGTHELSKAYMDSSHPDWKRAQTRVNELTRMTMQG